MLSPTKDRDAGHRQPPMQRGMTTLTITMLLLAIVTMIVLVSTNVAFFEQRTSVAENRSRLAEQAAEYSLNISGEWLKSKLSVIVSDAAGGWLESGKEKWAACKDATAEIAKDYVHPCESVPETASIKRDELYFYSQTGAADVDPSKQTLEIDASLATLTAQSNALFAVTNDVRAVLCRIDTSDPANPKCALSPVSGNNVAVTLVAGASMAGESAASVVRETWSSYSDFQPSSTVPLVASGTIEGLGNASIVASPNAGGFGLAASIWSPKNVDIESGAGGIGSVNTCHLGGYLGTVPVSDLKTTCATTNDCGCPGINDTDGLSGHTGGSTKENIDILDIDGNSGSLPDITFFPGEGLDDPNDPTDDNLFEWIFGVDYVAAEADTTGATLMNCGEKGDENCAVFALREDLGAEFVTCAELGTLGSSASGLYYVEDSSAASPCSLPSQLGSATSNAIVVVNDEAKVNGSTLIYGLLFVRSDTGTGAKFTGSGNAKVFGSVVVQGNVKITGGLELVWVDTSAASDDGAPPPARYFGRVSGSWLDDRQGF